MSDVASESAHPGGVSPARDINTKKYLVVEQLPVRGLEEGVVFSTWAQGEVFAHVSGLGLGVVTNGQIQVWESAGKIRRVSGAEKAPEKAQGGPLSASKGVAATQVAENTQTASSGP